MVVVEYDPILGISADDVPRAPLCAAFVRGPEGRGFDVRSGEGATRCVCLGRPQPCGGWAMS